MVGVFSQWGSSEQAPTESEEVRAIKFLLALVPGWALHPDIGLVQPRHTLEYELDVARRVQDIRDKYDPPPPPPPEEEIEVDIFG